MQNGKRKPDRAASAVPATSQQPSTWKLSPRFLVDFVKLQLRRRLYANAYFLMLTYLVTAGSGFLFWVAATRIATPSEVGSASAAISAAMLLATLATLGLPYAVIRYLPSAGKAKETLINSAFTTCGTVAALGAILFVVGLHWWAPSLSFVRQNLYLSAAFVLFTIGVALGPLMLLHMFVAHRRTDMGLLEGSMEGLLKLSLVAPLAIFFGPAGVFTAWGAAVLLAFTIGAFLLLPRVHPGYAPRPQFKKPLVTGMLKFSLANYISDLAWFTPASGLIGWILPLIVVNLLGTEKTAYFYITWLMAAMLNTVPVSTATSLFAEGSNAQEQLYSSARRSVKFVSLLLVPLVILVLVLSDKLLLIYGRPYSDNAAGLLRILALSTIPLAFNTMALGIWKVERNLKLIVALGIVIASVTVALTVLLTPSAGLLGVGWAWLSAQTAGAAILGRIAWQRMLSKHPPSPTG